MSKYRPPASLPTDPNQLVVVLLQQLRQISEDLASIPVEDNPTVVVQERVDVPAGSKRRISPPTTGGVAILEAPGPNNSGRTATIIIENPAGSLKVVASPHRASDGKITASTINDASQATYTLPGVVTFTSNGVDSWKTQVETPAESSATTTTETVVDALDATYHLQTASADLPNARVATTSAEIEVDYTAPGVVSWALQTASVVLAKLADLTGLSVLGRAANSSGVMAAITASTARHVMTLDDAGTSLAWGYPVQISQAGEVDHGDFYNLNLIEGTNADWTITPQSNGEVDISVTVDDFPLTGLADQADDTFLANISGGSAPPTAVALSTLAGDGLTGGTNAVLAVGGSTSITVNANDIQRAALTGFAEASANSNATTSAEPIVTYSASANMSAERVTTSSTSITVSTSVASQIEFQRAALTGDVTASANSNATTIANDAVTVAKLAHGGICTTLVSFGTFADPMWCQVMTEQFFGALGDARFIGDGWVWNTAGSMSVADLVGEAAHPGVRRFTRPSASGAGHSMAYACANTASNFPIDIADVAFMYFVFRAPSEATQASFTSRRFAIGLVQDAAATDGTAPLFGGNGLAIWKTDSNASWRVREVESSVATNTATATAVLGDWVEALLVNEGSGNWGVLVNGVDEGTVSGVVTSGMMLLSIGIETTSGVDAMLDVDEISIGFLPSANRYG